MPKCKNNFLDTSPPGQPDGIERKNGVYAFAPGALNEERLVWVIAARERGANRVSVINRNWRLHVRFAAV